MTLPLLASLDELTAACAALSALVVLAFVLACVGLARGGRD